MNIKLIHKLPTLTTNFINYNLFECLFGLCFIAKMNNIIVKLSFIKNQLELNKELIDLKHLFPQFILKHDNQLIEFFFESNINSNYIVYAKGTEFKEKVWQELLNIPYGQKSTYEAIALKMGKTILASRAIGTAIGSNTIAYLIPCHRVVYKNGKIGEFRWGTVTKKALLQWELKNRKDSSTLF